MTKSFVFIGNAIVCFSIRSNTWASKGHHEWIKTNSNTMKTVNELRSNAKCLSTLNTMLSLHYYYDYVQWIRKVAVDTRIKYVYRKKKQKDRMRPTWINDKRNVFVYLRLKMKPKEIKYYRNRQQTDKANDVPRLEVT